MIDIKVIFLCVLQMFRRCCLFIFSVKKKKKTVLKRINKRASRDCKKTSTKVLCFGKFLNTFTNPH
jgi:hypothetical protein